MTNICICVAGFAGFLLFLGALGGIIEWWVSLKEEKKNTPWSPCQPREKVYGDREPDAWEIMEERNVS